ncbi:transporter substrate-binding domain-containing protein [Micropruina sonneratiae]|uniref:transporter substrate-binding domain-containing protein n=1 Tax=Micropruina sonneratiae TaxID=2986940 RepID=UPI002227C16B|nr:transporter substrate-binding domain-containing protein [Micropruina sp. KQZ13P-5]MCW3156551.1 transporter substrate-binding domain-containing protein [Micropruina sp. KQZ13P-5]
MFSSHKRVRAALAGVAALGLTGLAACANYSTPTTAAPEGSASGGAVSLIEPGKLLVCTHLSYKPFQFKDDSGTVVGFDVDMMDLVAKKLGVTQEIVDIDFSQITSGAVFAAKKCDVGAAAVTITDERKQAVDFSDAYFKATQALLVKSDATITDLAGLKGKVLGVQTDTTGQIYAEKNKDANGYTIKVFDDMPSQLAAVQAGTVDGAVNDNGVVFDYAKENPTTKVVTEFDTGEQYGFLTQKGNTAMVDTMNEVITAAKSDGSYNDIYKKWLGSEPQA